MTVRFGNYRLAAYIAIFLASGTVLGLASNFAKLFLPHLHHDFTIFALIVPSLTIFVLLLTLQWAQPNTEAIALFILGVLWLALGAWSQDIIGFVQCDAIGGQRMATSTGDMSQRQYCYEMKVIEAFSWMNFVVFSISFFILIWLVSRAQTLGRPHMWEEPIRELPWFGELPGYYNTGTVQPTYAPYPAMQYPTGGQYMPMQTQGHSIIIQPGVNGQPPVVTQVPGPVPGQPPSA